MELQEKGLFDEAIAEYDQAIRLDPQLAVAFSNRGTAYVNLGQQQRAIEDHDEAIRLDRQLATAYANRALVYTLLSKDTEAQQDVDRAAQLGFDRSTLDGAIEELKAQR